jgi:hypothetical protein
MRWTRVALLTRALPCGRRSRVVLTPRRWRQVGGNNFCWRRWQESPVTWESAKQPLKPLRAGMPGDPGATVVTNACALLPYTRGCGCNGHPAFPTPFDFWGERYTHNSGASRRENAKMHVRAPDAAQRATLGRDALLIRGPCSEATLWVPALRCIVKGRCTASGTRTGLLFHHRPARRVVKISYAEADKS